METTIDAPHDEAVQGPRPGRESSKAMRVLMVTPRYFPLMGGVETHTYEVARRLAAQGVHTTVLTTDPGQTLPTEETVEGVHIMRVPAYPANRDFYVAPGIARRIAQGTWDIIHCQGFHTFVPPLAMWAAQRSHVPYILTFHSGGHSSGWRHSIRSVQAKLMRPLLAGATRLVGVSRFEAKLFQTRLNLPSEQFVVIPNGSHLPKVAAQPRNNDETLILSVGRLEKYKGHQRIIAAFPEILAQRPDARLRILGTGPYEPELKALVKELGIGERVEIGAIPPGNRQGMASVLLDAALVVLLSEYEAHPISVMEALSMKRPVLVADTSGLSELAERGFVRAIPLESTATQVAQAVLEQLRSPLVRNDIELPTWDECAALLLSLYETVIEEHQCAS
ncbi:MAG: glycosyltransferase family 4 protein [Pleurocapsa minor GSE-CHR-MK-17-07R]|nr:glycosyltransferase family 4 protein [Pleurocapsa minor GSE-CHR-MK 17-07R]